MTTISNDASRASNRAHLSRKCRSRERRGAILVLAIVCVAIAMSIMAMLVRFALLHRDAQKNQQRTAQANWLVESGLDRAAARLALDPAYSGETWKIPAAEFTATATAQPEKSALILIEVKAVAEQPRQRTIKVAADYPDDPKNRARRGKQIVVTLTPSTNGEKP